MRLPNPTLLVKEITDVFVKRNFENLVRYFDDNNQLVDFKFIEFETTKAETNFKVKHGLGFKPKDLIRLKVVGDGKVTFNYSLFDTTSLDVTTTDAVRVRLLVGTYHKDVSQAAEDSSDLEDWQAAIAAASSSSSDPTYSTRTITATGSLEEDDDILLCNPPAGSPMTVTLPRANTRTGKLVWIKKIDAYFTSMVTIQGFQTSFGYESVDGASTTTLCTKDEVICLYSNGTQWIKLYRDYFRGNQTVTFTGSWTANTTYSATMQRDGEYALFSVKAACTGAPTAAALTFTLPTGLTIDTSKLISTDADLSALLVSGMIIDSGVASYPVTEIGYTSTTTVRVGVAATAGAYATTALVTNVLPFAFGNADGVSVKFRVPISNWKG